MNKKICKKFKKKRKRKKKKLEKKKQFKINYKNSKVFITITKIRNNCSSNNNKYKRIITKNCNKNMIMI